MRLSVQVEGNVNEILTAQRRLGARAVTSAMRSAGQAIKMEWRGQIVRAGLGTRLANTVQSQTYPRSKSSLDAATLTWTRAPKIVGAFERGATIRTKTGVWLAVPLPAAGTGTGGRRFTPEEWERRRGLKLRFVYRPGAPALLVADGRQNKRGFGVESRSKTGRGRATVPIFILLPQVTLRKRLDLIIAATRMAANLPVRIVAGWR